MARTYKRDSRGRFASGGGGSSSSRPPARQVSRGANRLTRDNAGRITSVGGNGATARGGRLRTAAGNLRATQTTRLSGRRTGRVATPQAGARVNVRQGRSTAATKGLERGTFVRANLRPRNTMAKPGRGENIYNRFSGHNDQNIAAAQKWLEKRGHKVTVYSDPSDSAVARGTLGKKQIYLNKASQAYWSNPRLRQAEMRRSGFSSTSHPLGLLLHESGHNRHSRGAAELYPRRHKSWNQGITPFSEWTETAGRRRPRNSTPLGRIKQGKAIASAAKRVSSYAARNPVEFVAEVYAGRKTGRKYDYQVMRAYREAMGLRPTSARRTIRSRRRTS